MIRRGTILNVIDSSGIQLVKCLDIYTNNKFGILGCLMLIIVKRLLARKKYKKGERMRAVLVSSSNHSKKPDGAYYWFSNNNVILFNKRMAPLSHKIKGPIFFGIKYTRFKKLALLTRNLI